MYKNGQIILNVPVVTGDKSENNDTPTGNYEIVKKKLGNWLTGADYNSWVDYWIPFISNKYGFHDADWRSSGQLVNKSTYLTNGSHGCVNMFKEDAKNLYNNIDAGLSVTIVEKVYY